MHLGTRRARGKNNRNDRAMIGIIGMIWLRGVPLLLPAARPKSLDRKNKRSEAKLGTAGALGIPSAPETSAVAS